MNTRNREKIAKLEALLERIQNNTAAPRATHPGIPQVAPAVATIEPVVEDEPLPETVGTRVPEYRAPARHEEPLVEAVSGEFAVADMAMELEELGPADEVHDDEVVEIHVEEPMTATPPVVEVAPLPEPERISEPPASGRELVAPPHESARLAVAAPATPDPNALDLLTEEPESPPESARNLRAAPAVPQTSDVFDLEPQIKIEPVAAPPLDPRGLVDVVRPVVIPADVAAFTTAARAPRPETFGTLLDAALDL